MASPTLLTPTTTKPRPTPTRTPIIKSKHTSTQSQPQQKQHQPLRRGFLSISASILLASPVFPAFADDQEYVKDTEEVISKVRSTITMDRNDPNVASAVAELRDASNSWVAKYRREKALLGRASFRDIYSALNAVSGHYISFGPTAPIPAKRRARILEEMDTAEKALSRGR